MRSFFMPWWLNRRPVRLVSSQATRSASRKARSARRVMSSRLPIGVGTTTRATLGSQHVLPGGGVPGEGCCAEHARGRAEGSLLDLGEVAGGRASAEVHLLAGGLQ